MTNHYNCAIIKENQTRYLLNVNSCSKRRWIGVKDFTKVRERVERLNIIDDTFFQKMAEDIGFCEEMISTVMNEKVKVVQVIPQSSIKNLQGRSVIVDALCEKEDGSFVNVEVQKSNNDDHLKRVRYNASCITANIADPGTKFEKVPNLTMIYISNFDIFDGNRIIYHVDRTIRETHTNADNGLEEIYINTKVDDGSELAELMRIYKDVNAYNYDKFPHTSKRKAHFKKTEKGVEDMCDIVEEYANDVAKDYAKKVAKKMLRDGIASQKVVSLLETLTPGEVEHLAEQVKREDSEKKE